MPIKKTGKRLAIDLLSQIILHNFPNHLPLVQRILGFLIHRLQRIPFFENAVPLSDLPFYPGLLLRGFNPAADNRRGTVWRFR
ncbi:MAG: hypothetical protein IPL59_06645 [Candidatus Competibacteraceae bacterium]|nr:hypothetical protein [Candidatus Competibacteraceae bacterium]